MISSLKFKLDQTPETGFPSKQERENNCPRENTLLSQMLNNEIN